ncbi:MAG: hypothetical protein ABSG94_08460 [Brevinematales bacterium]
MPKSMILITASFTLLLCASCGNNTRRENMTAARNEIRVTGSVIARARIAVNNGQNFTGDLAKSVNEQKFAILLFNKSEFVRSRNHTMHARRLAYRAIKANNGRLTDQEIEYSDSYKGPPDSDLDADLQKNADSSQVNNTKDQESINASNTNTQDDLDIKVR